MKYIYILLTVVTIVSCNISQKESESLVQNDEFEIFKEAFLDQLWEMSPGWASWAGLHQYDSILLQPTTQNRRMSLITLDELADSLRSFEIRKLSGSDKIDYYLIRDYIESDRWYLQEYKSHEWNPSNFNIAHRAGRIINENFADITTRLRILLAYLKDVPSYYESALKNIKIPTLEHLELGLIQNRGGLTIFGETLLDSLSISNLDDQEKLLLEERIKRTKDAIWKYISSLEEMKSKLSVETAKSPRIGKELFFEKYRHDINADYTAEEIYLKALDEKKTLHSQMITISDTIWENYLPGVNKPTDHLVMVKMLIDKISEKHVKREDFFTEIKRQIKVLTDFVNEKDLLTQDPTKPLVVRELPLYMRGGGAGASINSPGPFDKEANTYYNVEPLDGYTDKEAESYLREYNHYILQILNIHEAIPGHYTQLVYGNKSPSVIKSILQNGAMIEGWANYAEIMMLEEGYSVSPEMWLMRNKWHLRGVTNTILDYSFHTMDLSKDDAMRLMVEEAFQEQTEADNKWRRLNLSSVQLSSYFTGFSQIYELRDEIKQLKGVDFNLKEFHEKFLGYGNAPVKYIRELMLSSSNKK
jgi:hypothetical protein